MPKIPKITIDCGPSFRITTLPTGRVVIEAEDVEAHGAPISADTLYSKAEVASRLGVSLRSVDNFMRQKKNPLPYTRSAGHPRFRESDVLRWLEAGLSPAARRSSERLGLV